MDFTEDTRPSCINKMARNLFYNDYIYHWLLFALVWACFSPAIGSSETPRLSSCVVGAPFGFYGYFVFLWFRSRETYREKAVGEIRKRQIQYLERGCDRFANDVVEENSDVLWETYRAVHAAVTSLGTEPDVRVRLLIGMDLAIEEANVIKDLPDSTADQKQRRSKRWGAAIKSCNRLRDLALSYRTAIACPEDNLEATLRKLEADVRLATSIQERLNDI